MPAEEGKQIVAPSGYLPEIAIAFENASGVSEVVDAAHPLPVTIISGGGGGSTVDREFVVSTYVVKTPFTGASVGDTVTATQILDVTGTPSTVSTIWRNQTTAADLGSPPSAANLTLVGSQALTDAQLRASAVATAPAAGENHIGKVGGETIVASASPAVSTTPAYSAGDVIGVKMTFANFGRVSGGTGLIQMVGIHCKSAQTFACDLILFHTDPGASTFTDNVALAVNAADFDKVLGVVHITDWTNLGTPSFAEATQLAMAYKVATGATDIYGVLVARATPTLASTSDVKVVVKALLD